MYKDRFSNDIGEVDEAVKKHSEMIRADYSDKNMLTQKMMQTKGHPLQTYKRENDKILQLTAEIRDLISSGGDCGNKLKALGDISIHYAEKGDIIYPLLKSKYDIEGPNSVMWTEDDVIRTEIKKADTDEKLLAVLTKIENMANKENNILYPICAVNFSDDDWYAIYRDEKCYDDAFGIKSEIWDEAPSEEPTEITYDEKIILPTGELSLNELMWLLNTLPMEITFVDINDKNKYFNEGKKLFKRPMMALGRSVYSCHPPKIEAMVKAIIGDFKSGKKDKVQVYSNKNGTKMCVTYLPVRDGRGEYLGTVELCQDMAFFEDDKR